MHPKSWTLLEVHFYATRKKMKFLSRKCLTDTPWGYIMVALKYPKGV